MKYTKEQRLDVGRQIYPVRHHREWSGPCATSQRMWKTLSGQGQKP